MAGHDHIGGFAVPSDVEAYGYTAVPATYQAGTALNQTMAELGLPAVFTGMEAIDAVETGWVFAAGAQLDIPPGSQAKFRLSLAGASHCLADDPIRNFDHHGASHLHMFYGNRGTNARSTYRSLRTRNSSGSAGGPLNGTAYWVPLLVKNNAFGDGRRFGVRSQNHIVYYNDNDVLNTHKMSMLVPGVRYIMGQNMDDPLQTFIDDEILAANSQPGTSPTRYRRWQGAPTGPCHGFNGWKQLSPAGALIQTDAFADQPNSDYSYGITNLDGSDPWGGAADPAAWGGLKCSLAAVLAAPHYWDRTNPWAPGGYLNFRYGIYDSVAGKYVGPHGWAKVPGLEQQFDFVHSGYDDYRYWELDSDAHFESLYGSPIPPGFSMHGDWSYGWQKRIFDTAQIHCNGVGNNDPHECNASEFSDTEGLLYTGQAVAWDGDTSTPEGMWLLPTVGTGKGPITIRTRHT